MALKLRRINELTQQETPTDGSAEVWYRDTANETPVKDRRISFAGLRNWLRGQFFPVPIVDGGTGSTTPEDARTQLGVPATADLAAVSFTNNHSSLNLDGGTNPHGTTKTDVGLGSVSDDAQLKIASNLGDLANVPTARTNLDVYSKLEVDQTRDNLQDSIDLKAPLAGATFSGNVTVNANLNINGDIIQSGAAYETHAEQVLTTKDKIIMREGALAGLAPGETSGLTAKLYDGTNDGELVFGNDGVARVGDVGSTQAIATREDSPTSGGISYWDPATNKFLTKAEATITGFDKLRSFESWEATRTYAQFEPCFEAGIPYRSLEDANVGNQPSLNPSLWEEVGGGGGPQDTLIGYRVGDIYSAGRATELDGEKLLNGQTVLVADYAVLVERCYVGDGSNATADYFYRCDNSDGTTKNVAGIYFKLPDARGLTLYGMGANGDIKAGDGTTDFDAGSYKYVLDQMQLIEGTWSRSIDTGPMDHSAVTTKAFKLGTTTRAFVMSATAGTGRDVEFSSQYTGQRTGAYTRGPGFGVNWFIKTSEAISEADPMVGSIQMYGGTTAPANWMFCHGQEVSRSEFPELFTIVGETFGAGDGSTTFLLPDFRNITAYGANASTRTISGIVHPATALGATHNDRMQQITGSTRVALAPGFDMSNPAGAISMSTFASGYYASGGAGTGQTINFDSANSVGSRTGSTTMSAGLGINFIIKVRDAQKIDVLSSSILREIKEAGMVVGQFIDSQIELEPSPWNPSDPDAYLPIIDITKAQTINETQYPKYIPKLRAEKAWVWQNDDPSTETKVKDFPGSGSGSTVVLTNTVENNLLLDGIIEDFEANGAYSRVLVIGTTEYTITNAVKATRVLTLSVAPPAGALTVSIHPYRVIGQPTQAKLLKHDGLVLATGGASGRVTGLVTRDRFQGHLHAQSYANAGSGGNGFQGANTGSNKVPITGVINIGQPVDDGNDGGSSGTPRTGSTTRDRSQAVYRYAWVGRLLP